MRESTKFTLENQNIDTTVEQIRSFFHDNGMAHEDELRNTLLLEEVLLNYRDRFGSDRACTLVTRTLASRRTMTIRIPGDSYNGIDDGDETYGGILRNLSTDMGIAPSWHYSNGMNEISYTFRKPKPKNLSLILILGAFVSAIVLGFVLRMMPENVQTIVNDGIIDPVFAKLLDLISAAAGPLVFLSVFSGIYGMGDTASFNKIGKTMIKRYLGISFLTSTLGAVVISAIFGLSTGSSSSFDFGTLRDMVLGMIPKNFFSPFIDSNPMQIIFVAFVTGVAALILSERSALVGKWVEQLNAIVQLIMEGISKLVPLFIFLCMLGTVSSGSLSSLAQSYQLIVTIAGLMVSAIVVYITIICIKTKAKPGTILKKTSSAFLIAFTTASSSASYRPMADACDNKLGIDRRLSSMALPIGQVVFMVGACTQFLSTCLILPILYDMPLTIGYVILTIPIATILAIAAPPIPGSNLTCYMIFVSHAGVPTDAMAILCALNVLTDMMSTATNIECLQLEMILLGRKLKMIDESALKS